MTRETAELLRGSAKAVLGGVVAAVSTAAVAASDGAISSGEWWGVAAAGVVALGSVYGIKNTGPKAPQG